MLFFLFFFFLPFLSFSKIKNVLTKNEVNKKRLFYFRNLNRGVQMCVFATNLTVRRFSFFHFEINKLHCLWKQTHAFCDVLRPEIWCEKNFRAQLNQLTHKYIWENAHVTLFLSIFPGLLLLFLFAHLIGLCYSCNLI